MDLIKAACTGPAATGYAEEAESKVRLRPFCQYQP